MSPTLVCRPPRCRQRLNQLYGKLGEPEHRGLQAERLDGMKRALYEAQETLYGELSGLPPLHLHVSDSELLRDDSLRLAELARTAKVQVNLKLWHGLPHAWPNFAGLMPEGDACLEQTAEALLHTTAA